MSEMIDKPQEMVDVSEKHPENGEPVEKHAAGNLGEPANKNAENGEAANKNAGNGEAVDKHEENGESCEDQRRELILRSLDSNDYIVECLHAEGILNERQTTRLLSTQDILERNIILMHFVKRFTPETLKSFVGVLRGSKHNPQTHVANLIENEDANNNSKEELPMSETRFEALEGTKPILSVMMASVDKIVDTLQRDNILTNIDRLNIYSKKEETTERERAERLIDTVKRKTDHAYDGLVDALNSTGQEHCTTYLTKGEILRFHVRSSQVGLDEAVLEYLSATARDPNRRKMLSLDLQQYNMSIVAAEEGKNLLVYIFCPSILEMHRLMEMLCSGRLLEIVDKLIARLGFSDGTPKTKIEFNMYEQKLARESLDVLLKLYEIAYGSVHALDDENETSGDAPNNDDAPRQRRLNQQQQPQQQANDADANDTKPSNSSACVIL